MTLTVRVNTCVRRATVRSFLSVTRLSRRKSHHEQPSTWTNGMNAHHKQGKLGVAPAVNAREDGGASLPCHSCIDVFPIQHHSGFASTEFFLAATVLARTRWKTVAELCEILLACCDLCRVPISLLFHSFSCEEASDHNKNDRKAVCHGLSADVCQQTTLATSGRTTRYIVLPCLFLSTLPPVPADRRVDKFAVEGSEAEFIDGSKIACPLSESVWSSGPVVTCLRHITLCRQPQIVG